MRWSQIHLLILLIKSLLYSFVVLRKRLKHEYNLTLVTIILDENLMWETQEDYYLVLFMFASQLYFYILGLSSLLGY